MKTISWIKLDIGLFDNEKIKLIRAMPDGAELIIIWLHLLTLAGKINDKGKIYINDCLFHTVESLSTITQVKLTTIEFALKTFSQFKMIEIFEDGMIEIANWKEIKSLKE